MTNQTKILLVDDDEIFLKLAELALNKEKPGMEIFKVYNGKEALEFLSDNQVDVIYLDLNMPVMNGWGFLEEYATKEIDSKIFILTSSIDPSDKERAKENPFVSAMLEKPLNKAKIALSLG